LPRAIDHLVVASHDLEAQAALYRRLGFQVGARNRHPWGTENHIVQFDGAFLELIGLGQGFGVPAPQPGVYSFPGFVSGFLAKREGLAMLAMRSADAEADSKVFAAHGLGDFARFDFGRKARRSDGEEVGVAFSLAFAANPALPQVGFFVSEHKFPENFWNRAAQVHPNGARKIAGVVVAHERPRDVVEFIRRFVGAPDPVRVEGGWAVAADGASIEVIEPAVVNARYGERAGRLDGPMLALARIAVADTGAMQRRLMESDVRFERRGQAFVVGARAAMGAGLVFEAAQPCIHRGE
jgi:hypothetical protein